jgi:c-di-GMP-binding flagellar brake protein YcgR
MPVDVVIHAGDKKSLKYRAHNISQGGLLVKKEGLTQIWNDQGVMNKVVHVEFNEGQFVASLPAMVVRHSEQSAALMFISYHPALRSFLHELKIQKENSATSHAKKLNEQNQTPSSRKLRLIYSN